MFHTIENTAHWVRLKPNVHARTQNENIIGVVNVVSTTIGPMNAQWNERTRAQQNCKFLWSHILFTEILVDTFDEARCIGNCTQSYGIRHAFHASSRRSSSTR
jgi:hypothetical protein